MALNLPRLQRLFAIAESDGNPTTAFQQWWQQAMEQIEAAVGGLTTVNIDVTNITDTVNENAYRAWRQFYLTNL